MALPKVRRIIKRAGASAVAALTALGVLLGGSFDSPAELLGPDKLSAPLVAGDTLLSNDSQDDGSDDGAVPGEEKKKGARSRFRQRVLALPLWLRGSVLLPLWGLGWVLLSAFSLLWQPLLSPLASALFNCLCVALVLLAVVLMTVKAAFPDMPLKEIVTRRNIYSVFFCALAFGAAGALMQIFMPEYDRLRDIAEGVLILVMLVAVTVPVLRKEAGRRRKAAQIAESTIPHKQDRKKVLELADSVS